MLHEAVIEVERFGEDSHVVYCQCCKSDVDGVKDVLCIATVYREVGCFGHFGALFKEKLTAITAGGGVLNSIALSRIATLES